MNLKSKVLLERVSFRTDGFGSLAGAEAPTGAVVVRPPGSRTLRRRSLLERPRTKWPRLNHN
jgi:hypothetical protein